MLIRYLLILCPRRRKSSSPSPYLPSHTSWRPPTSPKSQQLRRKGPGNMPVRAHSLEGLIEPAPPRNSTLESGQVNKSVSLENELDTISDVTQTSDTDSTRSKTKNFMDKCVNKMKSLINKKPASHET
ncbi:hypothetical protein M8J76_004804 [Diaphorina citri]|nr:hypothetical protein M8J75_015659 [Diaphorina citri]KAI5719079.1 hypothetical protein M8J76_004804 [Diaphorina citri]